ncbi:hypothetical protein BDW74DRAFT_172890 [Aspergillus multicolor]|uniref:uncharacterized protein n=1 Tax=Aspergillus multicolor TaxID=41759 RepID=UPI003CCD2C49
MSSQPPNLSTPQSRNPDIPLRLTIITTGHKSPADPFQWTILVGPRDADPSEPRPKYITIHIYHSPTGYYSRSLEVEQINQSDMDTLAAEWPYFEVVCQMPPKPERYRFISAIDQALGQRERRWVSDFLDVLVKWEWIGEDVKGRVEGKVLASPWEPV